MRLPSGINNLKNKEMKKYTNKLLGIMVAVVIICFVVMIYQVINVVLSYVQ